MVEVGERWSPSRRADARLEDKGAEIMDVVNVLSARENLGQAGRVEGRGSSEAAKIRLARPVTSSWLREA